MDIGIPYFPNDKINGLPEPAKNLWKVWKRASDIAGGVIPTRSSIKAYDLGEDASNCFIVERVGPRDFVFHMSGTGFDKLFGESLTGKKLTAIAHEDGRDLICIFCEALVATPCAGFVRDLMVTMKGEKILSEGFNLPLADESGGIKYIICVSQITSMGFSGEETPTRTQADYRKVKAAYFIHLEDEKV